MSEDHGQREVIDFLSAPETHGGETVERMSTHGAHIFLAGNLAYKVKRAVKLPFMDYSTVELRRAMLEEEFAVNRDLARGLYVGVKPIRRDRTGKLSLGGEGEILDWVLVMRRFAQTDLLDDMARRNALPVDMMETLADVVADMHARAPVIYRQEPAFFTRMALDNIAALDKAPLERAAVGKVADQLAQACDTLGEHLQQRAAEGFVRRCHGDLHLRNIVCLDSRPTPFDALEFDAALATGDVYYDLAFLLMDLDHRGLGGHACRLLNRYVTKTNDIEGLKALALFLAVRAAVRTKVSVISARSATPSAEAQLLDEARAYLSLAGSYLPAATPCLVAVGGLSGTGKSRAALALAPHMKPAPGALVLRSDVVRKQLHGVSETTRLPADAYGPDVTARVYTRLMTDACRSLAAAHSCILDAVFARESEREAAETIARDLGVPFIGFWLDAATQVRQARVQQRVKDASDADASVVAQQETYDVGEIGWHRVDANGDLANTTRQLTETYRRYRR